jgi:hypothetical protein
MPSLTPIKPVINISKKKRKTALFYSKRKDNIPLSPCQIFYEKILGKNDIKYIGILILYEKIRLKYIAILFLYEKISSQYIGKSIY